MYSNLPSDLIVENKDLEEIYEEKTRKRLELKDTLEKQFSEISQNETKPLFKVTPKNENSTYQRMLENNFGKPPK
jgi:phage-related baseplate assembly protein